MNKEEIMTLSVIVTYHRTPILLKFCLNSLQESVKELKHEIIVVDSETNPEAVQPIKESFPQVKFIPFRENVGYAKLVNTGLRQSQGDYLLIMNADIIVQKEAIPQMLAYLQAHPQVGLVGPQLLTFAHRPQKSAFRFPTLGTILARRTFVGRLKWGKEKWTGFKGPQ